MQLNQTLKAYAVHDNYEGYCCVVFATNSATARREGASELDIDWYSVETCRRAPEFDQYSPGPIPPLTLIEHGWWFECQHCGRRCSNDMAEDLESDDLDPADFVPRASSSGGVFCSASCECADHMEKRGRAEATEALIEVFEAKFPGATLTGLHVYGGPLLLPPDGKSIRYAVYFTFPGGKRAVTWEFGDENVSLDACDSEAYKAWRSA